MKKAAIYARFSSARQKETSITDQLDACREYCARKGYEVVAEYKDSEKSGTNDDRPGFQLMLSECSEWDVLVVYKLDRFARNRFDSLKNKKVLRDNGARLESACETMPEGPEGIIIEGLFDAMNEYYSANLAQNVMRGMSGRARQCKCLGHRTFGYDVDPVTKDYLVNEEEAEVVRSVFETRAAGYAIDASDYAHVRTVRGYAFTNAALNRLVRNEMYKGVYKWNDVRVEGGVPRIVSDELWETAQKGRRKKYSASGEPYWLTGKLYGEDGVPSVGDSTTNRHGTTYRYYKANGSRVQKHLVEDAVASCIAGNMTEEVKAEIVAAYSRARDEEQGKASRYDMLDAQLSEVVGQIENVAGGIAAIGPVDSLLEKMRLLEKERGRIEAQMAAETKRAATMAGSEIIEFWLDNLTHQDNVEHLIGIFLDHAVLYRDGFVECFFTFGGSDEWPIKKPAGQAAGSDGSEWWPISSNIRMSMYGIAVMVHI